MAKVELTRGEKILLVLFDLSKGSRQSIRYEDIVVAVFKRFPDNFHLKGYPEHPDSGDVVHRPLYGFKKKGLVQAGNKMFALTERGVVAAEQLNAAVSGNQIKETVRLRRDVEKEVARISKTSGFTFFVKDDTDKLVDTDFFDYMGATVRTPRNDFIGRLDTVTDAIKAIRTEKEPLYRSLCAYHDLMMKNFGSIVDYKKEH